MTAESKDYTPTIDDVREMWAGYQDQTWDRFEDHLEEFDRFIRKVKADTLREFAKTLDTYSGTVLNADSAANMARVTANGIERVSR